MTLLLALLGLALLGLLIGLLIWYLLPRRFRGSQSVASAYDQWTQDQLLERLWGEHIHLGFYGQPPQQRDFRVAKQDFVDALACWGEIDQLPAGTKVLMVLAEISETVRLSVRNLPELKLIAADQLNVFDLLNAKKLVVSEEAIVKIQEVYGNG